MLVLEDDRGNRFQIEEVHRDSGDVRVRRLLREYSPVGDLIDLTRKEAKTMTLKSA